jgi:hypothetical protein
MPGSRADKNARREVLDDLARELNRPGGPGCRVRRTARLVPYLSVRRVSQGRLRVYCAGTADVYALLTSDGQLIRLDGGAAAAARQVAAACGRAGPGREAVRQRAGRRTGP